MSNAPGPPLEVLEAFGLSGRIENLLGGGEVSVVVDGVVLKQVMDSDVAVWCQEVLFQIEPCGYRVPSPLRAADDSWQAFGWIASEFVADLKPMRHDPRAIIRAGEMFTDDVTKVAASDHAAVLARTDRWADADRFVWDEIEVGLSPETRERSNLLRQQMVDRVRPSVVIHGDLAGNMFTDALGEPVVIDFSPLIRPLRYQSGIVIADTLLWGDGDASHVDLLDGDLDALARGLLFRLMSSVLALDSSPLADLEDISRILHQLGWD